MSLLYQTLLLAGTYYLVILLPVFATSKETGTLLESFEGSRFPNTFEFEATSPQGILVGCRGAQYWNGTVSTIFYLIDATGQRKYVEPGQIISVEFPIKADEKKTNTRKVKEVGFNEICFPNDCGVSNCNIVIGPLVTFPRPAKGSNFISAHISGHGQGNNFVSASASSSELLGGSSVGGWTLGPSQGQGASSSGTSVEQIDILNPPGTGMAGNPNPAGLGGMGPSSPGGGSMCNCCQMCQGMPPMNPGGGDNSGPGGMPPPTFPNGSPGPGSLYPIWPNWFFGKEMFSGAKVSKIRKDAEYYASLPGSIRGSSNIIYYPSCEKDAYVQPAILNYCPNTFDGSKTSTATTSVE